MAEKEVTIKVTTETDVSQMEDLTNMLDDAKGKANEVGEELKTAFEEATATVEELEEELANIEMGESDADFNEISEQLEEATQHAQNLEDTLNSIGASTLDDASSSANELADGLSNASANAEDLSSSMGLIESTMLMDMATQIGGLGDQAEGMAQDMNQASISVGQLATNAGIAEPKMVSLINYISNKTFPQEEAMGYVNVLNQMGVSADKLGDSATNMDKINDATGMGYNNVMLLTQGLTAVGVSADNLPSAFNAIAYAEANVGGGAQTLQQVLKRQAGTLNEYGMGVDETVVALSALQRQTGLTGMKLGSEFSSRLKDCNGDIGQLEQSLGLANGTLQNANQITGEYDGTLQQLADEEMQHKTFIDELNAGWEDMQLMLAPVLSPLMSFVGIIGSFGQTALAINSLITLAETFGLLKTATLATIPAQIAEGIAGMISIGWALIAVAIILAVIAVLAYLYFTNEDVRNSINAIGEAIMWIVGTAYNLLMGFWNYLVGLGGNITGFNNDLLGTIINGIVGFFVFFATLPVRIGTILVNALAKALGFGDNFVQRMMSAGMNSVNNFMSFITQLPSKLATELQRMLSAVNEWASTLPQKFWDAGVNAVKNFLNALDINSPGIMARSMVEELARIDKATGEADFSGNISELGKGMVNSFNPNLDMNGASVNSVGGGDTIINIYGDVDNDARIQQIVDVVRRELSWNNTTAGRTV